MVKPNVGATGLFPDWGAEIPYASWSKEQNTKKTEAKRKNPESILQQIKDF